MPDGHYDYFGAINSDDDTTRHVAQEVLLSAAVAFFVGMAAQRTVDYLHDKWLEREEYDEEG